MRATIPGTYCRKLVDSSLTIRYQNIYRYIIFGLIKLKYSIVEQFSLFLNLL
jgi:hypothetical protein